MEPPTAPVEALAAHDGPVDVVQGDEDRIPVANAEELVATLPDARIHVIEGADHSFVGGDVEAETVERTVDLLTDDR